MIKLIVDSRHFQTQQIDVTDIELYSQLPTTRIIGYTLNGKEKYFDIPIKIYEEKKICY